MNGLVTPRWSMRGSRFEIQVFDSPDLPRWWLAIDEVVGPYSVRLLAPVTFKDGGPPVINHYETA